MNTMPVMSDPSALSPYKGFLYIFFDLKRISHIPHAQLTWCCVLGVCRPVGAVAVGGRGVGGRRGRHVGEDPRLRRPGRGRMLSSSFACVRACVHVFISFATIARVVRVYFWSLADSEYVWRVGAL